MGFDLKSVDANKYLDLGADKVTEILKKNEDKLDNFPDGVFGKLPRMFKNMTDDLVKKIPVKAIEKTLKMDDLSEKAEDMGNMIGKIGLEKALDSFKNITWEKFTALPEQVFEKMKTFDLKSVDANKYLDLGADKVAEILKKNEDKLDNFPDGVFGKLPRMFKNMTDDLVKKIPVKVIEKTLKMDDLSEKAEDVANMIGKIGLEKALDSFKNITWEKFTALPEQVFE